MSGDQAAETFDFVVVGSGGGGLCAALVARSLGLSVVVLEKVAQVGGATAISGGVVWVPNNRFMRRGEDSPAGARDYLDAVVGDLADAPGGSPARRAAYLEQAPRMIDFLVAHGVKLRRLPDLPDYYLEASGASREGRTVAADLYDTNRLGAWKAKLRPGFLPIPARLEEAKLLPKVKKSWAAKRTLARVLLRGLRARLRGRSLVTAGNALTGWTLEAALKAGAEIRTEVAVEALVTDAEGAVTGVRLAGGRTIAARRGVLIAAGGFARNQRLLDLHASHASAERTLAPEGDTGDLLEAAVALGAATAQLDVRIFQPMALPPGKDGAPGRAGIQNELAKPHGLAVDQSGRRYMSEAGTYMDVCGGMIARDREVPAVPSWLVMDRRFLETYMLAGSFPGLAKPAAWTESGFLRKGGTLAELARACDLDPAALAATVERFNGFASAGRDADFGRGDSAYHAVLGDEERSGAAATLGTVAEAPFFAIRFFPGDVGSFGGLVTDTDARVLRSDGAPIPGLYATGTAAASVFGRTSPAAGSSIGPTYTWGYVAAMHAGAGGNRAGATA